MKRCQSFAQTVCFHLCVSLMLMLLTGAAVKLLTDASPAHHSGLVLSTRHRLDDSPRIVHIFQILTHSCRKRREPSAQCKTTNDGTPRDCGAEITDANLDGVVLSLCILHQVDPSLPCTCSRNSGCVKDFQKFKLSEEKF